MYAVIGPFQFMLPEQFEWRRAQPSIRHLSKFTHESEDPSIPVFRMNIIGSLSHPPTAMCRRVGNVYCFSGSEALRQVFITPEMKSAIDWEGRRMDIELLPFSEDPEFDATGKVMVLLRLLVSFAVLRSGGLPLHCSCVGKDGSAVAFFGKSGAGKTTIARIMSKNGWQLLNDEYNLLIPDGCGGYRAFSTPFSKTLEQVSNPDAGVGIINLFGLHRGEFSVAALPMEKAVRALIESVYMFPDFAATRGVLLDTAAAACTRLSVRDLRFGNCEATAGLIENILNGGK